MSSIIVKVSSDTKDEQSLIAHVDNLLIKGRNYGHIQDEKYEVGIKMPKATVKKPVKKAKKVSKTTKRFGDSI